MFYYYNPLIDDTSFYEYKFLEDGTIIEYKIDGINNDIDDGYYQLLDMQLEEVILLIEFLNDLDSYEIMYLGIDYIFYEHYNTIVRFSVFDTSIIIDFSYGRYLELLT